MFACFASFFFGLVLGSQAKLLFRPGLWFTGITPVIFQFTRVTDCIIPDAPEILECSQDYLGRDQIIFAFRFSIFFPSARF